MTINNNTVDVGVVEDSLFKALKKRLCLCSMALRKHYKPTKQGQSLTFFI